MTKHERSSRPDRLSLGRPADPMLDALLDRSALPDEDPARWQPVAQVLTALTSAPESSELAGEARALAAFRSRARGGPLSSRSRGVPLSSRSRGVPVPSGTRGGPVPSRTRRRNQGWAVSPRVPRPAVAAATGIVAMGGLLAVAYAGDLPAAAQRLAHDTIGAPAAARDSGPGSGPAAPGPASPLTRTASQGNASSGYGPPGPDRRVPRRHSSGFPYQHWPASYAPGASPSGRPGQYSPGQYTPGQGTPGQGTPGQGTPGGSPTPVPTQQPSPWASFSPSAGATPSPSAMPSASQLSRHHHDPAPAATESFPP